jgi:hypothetical protein
MFFPCYLDLDPDPHSFSKLDTDPGPHSLKKLHPDPHKVNVDPKHCSAQYHIPVLLMTGLRRYRFATVKRIPVPVLRLFSVVLYPYCDCSREYYCCFL